jgi:selenocysteine lyase/cysteine desulfurase
MDLPKIPEPTDGCLLSPQLLEEIRARLMYVDHDPFMGPRIFLENAGGSLRLRSVCEAASRESAIPDNEGRETAASAHVSEVIRRGRDDARRFCGARSGQVVAAQTTSQVIFRVIRAIAEHVPGSNIVTTGLEHPAIFDSTQLYAESCHKAWRVADLNPVTGGVDPEAILREIDADTCLLAFIHASNITGTVLDAARIIREARRINPKLYVVIDGTQHAPHALVDVEALGCDAYCFAPYKILGKVGIGFGWISDRVAALPHDRLLGKPLDYWDLGTQEPAAYAGWSAVVDYLDWLGQHATDSADRRVRIVAAMNLAVQHEQALLRRALLGGGNRRGLLAMPHVVLHGYAPQAADHDCVLAFNIEGLAAPEAVRRYREAGVVVHYRLSDAYSRHVLHALGVDSLVRFSALHYNTPTEVDRFIEVTDSLRGDGACPA